MNLLEPWILLRLVAGLTAALLFVRGAATSFNILRHFDVRRATEGQLALEKQMELATTCIRIAAVLQIGALVLTALAADRLSGSVRGAMCAYGVLHENVWGFRALAVTGAVALVAGVTVQLCAFDRRVRSLDLVRPIAVLSVVMAPLALLDLATTAAFFGKLDLSVVASCCSVQLDAGAAGDRGFATGPREIATFGAVIAVSTSALFAWAASIRPRALVAAVGGLLSLAAAPFALAAVVLDVAPHAFELPQHACPFCLLRSDVLGVGYPLFGAIFLAVVWSVGAGAAGLASRGEALAGAFTDFARSRLRRGALAWAVALAIGAGPIVRYALISGGRPLFP